MKSWRQFIAALVACAWLVACQRQPDLSRLGPPSQRLVGHWVSNSGDHEYFGPADASGTGSFILVRDGGPPVQQRYRIRDADPRTQTVRVELLGADGGVTERSSMISEDGESATVTTSGDKTALAFVRMDDAMAPKPSRAAAPAPATSAARAHVGRARASSAPGPFGMPANLPNGEYHRALVRYDGLKPVYEWVPLTPRDKTPLGATFSPSRAVAQHQSYLLWLHATAFALLLITTLLFAGELGAATLLIFWTIAAAIGAIGVFVLHAPLIAGIAEIATGLVLLLRAMFPKSDLL